MRKQFFLQLMFILMLSTVAVANNSPEKAPDSYLRDIIVKNINTTKKVQIDLYVMSQCPYGVNAEKALIPILKEMEENATFNIFFIANQKSDNEFSALHGESEVLENRRQLIIKRHFNNNFLDYLAARAKDYSNDDWTIAAKAAKLDIAKIEALMSSETELTLFKKNITYGNIKRIYGSPTLFINGQKYRGSYAPKKVKKVLADGTCIDGSNAGGACTTDADCSGKACDGGPNAGAGCTADLNCGQCQNGSEAGSACAGDNDCDNACVGGNEAGSTCANDTECDNKCSGGADDGTVGCTGDIDCDDACVGGPDDGNSCTGDIDCSKGCSGGPDAGNNCTNDIDCAHGCQGGADEGDPCTVDVDCTHACVGGADDGGDCTTDVDCSHACVGGADIDAACTSDIDCSHACTGGTNDGTSCTSNINCTGGGTCTDLGSCSNTGACSNLGTCDNSPTCDGGNCGDAGTCDEGTCGDVGTCNGGTCKAGTCDVPLPVELVNFKVTLTKENQVLLRWKTLTETNNEGFEVQHSRNAKDWETIDFVEGFGTVTEAQNYNWTHENPETGINYYRLKQIDHNGDANISKAEAIEIKSNIGLSVQAFPNPTSGVSTLYIPSNEEGKIIIYIINLEGKPVKILRQNIEIGENMFFLDLNDLAAGLYHVAVEYDGKLKTKTEIMVTK